MEWEPPELARKIDRSFMYSAVVTNAYVAPIFGLGLMASNWRDVAPGANPDLVFAVAFVLAVIFFLAAIYTVWAMFRSKFEGMRGWVFLLGGALPILFCGLAIARNVFGVWIA